MKYSILLLLFTGLWVVGFGQVPQAFKYQAVVRDATGGTVVNRVVSLRLSLLEGNPLGNAVYMEAHQLATNEFGLVSLEVGHGEPLSGIFETINWGSSDFYLKTELDLAGQGNLEKLKSTKGEVSYGVLYDYVFKAVRDRSLMEKSIQSPGIRVNPDLNDKWKEIEFIERN